MGPHIKREARGSYIIVDDAGHVFGKPHKTWRSASHSLHTINEIIETGGAVFASVDYVEIKVGGTD